VLHSSLQFLLVGCVDAVENRTSNGSKSTTWM
jgi:hypothetical protein